MSEIAGSKLDGCDHEAEPIGAAAQSAVERHELATEDLRQRDVLGVLGSTPAELLGEPPSRLAQVRTFDSPDGTRFQTVVLKARVLLGDLAFPQGQVQRRASLGPHQRRCDQIRITKCIETAFAGEGRDYDSGIDDEGQRRPRRDSWSSATQFGCGVPSSKVFQASGMPTRSSLSSSSTTIRAFETSGGVKASTSRCSCSRVAMPSSLPAARHPTKRRI